MKNPDAERADIETAFIRTFSTGGLVLTGLRPAERAERIRIAIFKAGLAQAMYDETRSYAEAYALCYRRVLEMRATPRDEPDEDDDEAEEES